MIVVRWGWKHEGTKGPVQVCTSKSEEGLGDLDLTERSFGCRVVWTGLSLLFANDDGACKSQMGGGLVGDDG